MASHRPEFLWGDVEFEDQEGEGNEEGEEENDGSEEEGEEEGEEEDEEEGEEEEEEEEDEGEDEKYLIGQPENIRRLILGALFEPSEETGELGCGIISHLLEYEYTAYGQVNIF